ncbi:MAG TPA: HAMP domain-containing protein, partial [Dissulfurispiraceae bacterium]
MSIKAKLLLAFLSVSLIIGLLGGVVFFRDIGQAEQIAQREAAAIATAISLFASHEIEEGEISYPFGKHELQAVVENFRQIQDRNITLVDMEKNIVADALFQQVGTVFPHDSPNDEVGQTLKDGKIRAFSETCKFYPQRAKLIVAPLNLHNGTRIGAVVLEYTSLYKNLFKQARSTAEQILSVYLCALAASLAVGFLIYRHIAIPVRNLRNAALQIASGDLETKVLCRSNDELGSLAESFNLMTDNLKSTQDKLLES